MIDVIEIIVSINGAKATMSEQIYSNNANQYRALVKFEDESWENYDKMIVFDRVKNYDTPIGIMVNNDNEDFIEIVDNRNFYCVIPWEVLTQPGYFTISIHGTLNGSQKSIPVKDKITIYDGGNTTIYPRVPTPNMYEQLLGIMKEISDKVDTNTKSDAGRTTPEGGEIFNDYENNKAMSNYSTASGVNTLALGEAQFVIGKYNERNFDALFIVGNGSGDDDENRSNAFVVNKDGSATIQTSGTGDLNVVNYKQLKDYVAKNKGSAWDEQSKMLFSTGALKIVNHVPTSELENDYDYGIYLDNNYSENAQFTSYNLYLGSRANAGSASLTNSDLTIINYMLVPNISLKKIDDMYEPITSLDINTNGITYNSKSITWDRLFATIEKIENLVDVSVEGQ